MNSYKILVIIGISAFIGNMIMYFFLLGGGVMLHTPIYLASIFIFLAIFASVTSFTQATLFMFSSRKRLSVQQIFFLSGVFLASLIPSLQLFVRRFQDSLHNDLIFWLVKAFNFLYIEVILLFILSHIMVNIKYHRSQALLISSLCFSIIVSKIAPVGYSKISAMYDFFIGGKWFLTSLALSLCLIMLFIYCIDLIQINIKKSIIFFQIFFFLAFLLSFHALILFTSLFVTIPAAIIMVSCLQIYLRGIFIHVL